MRPLEGIRVARHRGTGSCEGYGRSIEPAHCDTLRDVSWIEESGDGSPALSSSKSCPASEAIAFGVSEISSVGVSPLGLAMVLQVDEWNKNYKSLPQKNVSVSERHGIFED